MTKSSESKSFKILRYIYDEKSANGYAPTVREIGEAVGLSSTSTVHGHIDRLTKQGLLKKNPSQPRTLEITQSGLETLGITEEITTIPDLGVVTAGQPILAVEDPAGTFPVPDKFKNEARDLFMLTIRGNSMINIGILNGDKVIVRRQNSAENGQVVIAMTEDDEATCKRFFKENDRYRLQPENDDMDPIYLTSVTILGIVVALYRDTVV